MSLDKPRDQVVGPRLSAVVVHWHNEDHLKRLLAAWPDDPRCELLVVDNSGDLQELPAPTRLLNPAANLGFAGGVNHGARAARGEWVLLLNPDVRPEEGSVESFLDSLEELEPDGLVPMLVGEDGCPQTRWQLRPLPSPTALLLQTFFVTSVQGPRKEPERGAVIAQPAGAAVAIRRRILEQIGGLDEGYYPAWFEDVDLALKLQRAGYKLLYEPRSRFCHAMGGSLPTLGYGPFLWIYYRNLVRYLALHHGQRWSVLTRFVLPLGMLARLAFLPLRKPHRARSRSEAALGLLAVVVGTTSGWRLPRPYVRRFTRPGKAR